MKEYFTDKNLWANILLAGLFHFFAYTGYAATYYVSNSGNDANSGTTPETAWQTINKVNNTAFASGDRILFQRGDEWREQLTISSSGISGNPIVFDAYGSGPRPVINGSDLVTNWNQVNNSQVWQASLSDPKIVLFDNELGRERLTKVALDTDGDWFWSNGILYIYSEKAPSTKKIEAGARNYGIVNSTNNEINIRIQNIEVKGQKRMGIAFRSYAGDIPNSGIDISNCYVHHTRLMGFWFYEYDGAKISHSRAEYTATGFYCSPNTNNTVFSRDTSMYNIAYRNGLNTNGSSNDGSGIGIEESGGCIVEYCVVQGNGDGGIVVDNNNVDNYDAILRYNKALGSQGEDVPNNNAGFYIARIGTGSTVLMHNNISYDYGRNWNSNLWVQIEEAADIKIYNNTFVNPSTVDGDVIRWYQTTNANVDFRNNIVVSYKSTPQAYQLRDATNNDFTYSNYNLFYAPNAEKPFKMGTTKYADLSAWQTATGLDANSAEGNPLFTTEFTDFSLQTGSPAIDAGTDVGLTNDINGNPIEGAPDIGAVELQKKNENQKKDTIEDITICEGSSYKGWRTTGQYMRTLVAASGADSIVTTNLTVNPVYYVEENISILEGENYQDWTESGQYERILTAITGCDSIVTTHLTVRNLQHHTIPLEKGWNIFSSYLIPRNENLNNVFAKLQHDNLLLEVQDEAGNTYEKAGDEWVNNIGEFAKSEGYKIKVKSPVDLILSGYPVNLPLTIPLMKGWNIISFPYNGSVDALNVLQPLIETGILGKVQDEKGNSIENWGSSMGWINGIGNVEVGEGYLVQVSQYSMLPIWKNYEKSGKIVTSNIQPVYFHTDYEGNGSGHMNINIGNLLQSGLKAGDELAAYDGKICVGAVKLSKNNMNSNAVSLAASVSDESGPNGFTEGNPIEIRVWHWNKGAAIEASVKTIEGNLIYQRHGSVFVRLMKPDTNGTGQLNSFMDVTMYPNPASEKATLEFSLQPDKGTRIVLTDLTGKQLMVHQVKSSPVVLDVQYLPGGIYLIKIESGNKTSIHKLIIN